MLGTFLLRQVDVLFHAGKNKQTGKLDINIKTIKYSFLKNVFYKYVCCSSKLVNNKIFTLSSELLLSNNGTLIELSTKLHKIY